MKSGAPGDRDRLAGMSLPMITTVRAHPGHHAGVAPTGANLALTVPITQGSEVDRDPTAQTTEVIEVDHEQSGLTVVDTAVNHGLTVLTGAVRARIDRTTEVIEVVRALTGLITPVIVGIERIPAVIVAA